MNRYLIVADDFTGANDTGVQLRRRGVETEVVLSEKLLEEGNCSYVIDTETRGMTGQEAYNTVKKMCADVCFDDYKYVIKKVDSTLRGNVAEEIKATDEAFNSEIVVFAPALPDLDRTTINGIHCLKGVPITKTELAKDPKKPVKEDNIKKILENVYDEPVIHIDLSDVDKGNIDFSRARVFTFDALTNEKMKTIIKKGIETGKKILWVGTAAIADNLFEIEYKTFPALAVIGSVSSVTRSQVKYAEDNGIEMIKVPMYDIINQEKSTQYYIDKATNILSQGRDLVILSSASYTADELDKTVDAGLLKGMKKEETSVVVQGILGDIANGILDKVQVSGVFLTGGDTAIGMFEKVGAYGSSILGEVAVGIPLMKLRGGKFDGMKIITKAGAFGKEDVVTYSLRKLKEKN